MAHADASVKRKGESSVKRGIKEGLKFSALSTAGQIGGALAGAALGRKVKGGAMTSYLAKAGGNQGSAVGAGVYNARQEYKRVKAGGATKKDALKKAAKEAGKTAFWGYGPREGARKYGEARAEGKGRLRALGRGVLHGTGATLGSGAYTAYQAGKAQSKANKKK